MKLADLQNMFAEALVIPRSIAPDAKWSARGSETLHGSARLSPIDQLDVYREQFWLRHVACLAEDFPILVALVGNPAFEKIVSDYVAAHPPLHFQLRHFGAALADFLEIGKDRLLADLARLEWAFIDAFDAADRPPLDPKRVETIAEDDWPRVKLTLHPSLQLLNLVYPTHKIREKYGENEALRPIERVSEAPTQLVVYRQKFLMYLEEMDPLGFAMLARLANGEALGAAGDALAEQTGRGEEIENRIGSWFTRWSALGWIVDAST